MANQTISVVGNIGAQPTFKQGEYSLCEIFLIADEVRRTDDGQLETVPNSSKAYAVTVWGSKNFPESLDVIKVLQKGMRIQVEGAFKPGLFTDESSGEIRQSLNISCNPSDVSLKLNRIESIKMKPKRNQDQYDGAPQAMNAEQQMYGGDYPA